MHLSLSLSHHGGGGVDDGRARVVVVVGRDEGLGPKRKIKRTKDSGLNRCMCKTIDR